MHKGAGIAQVGKKCVRFMAGQGLHVEASGSDCDDTRPSLPRGVDVVRRVTNEDGLRRLEAVTNGPLRSVESSLDEMASFSGGVAEGAKRQQRFESGGSQLGMTNGATVARENTGSPIVMNAGLHCLDDTGEQPLANIATGDGENIAFSHRLHHLVQPRVGFRTVELVPVEQHPRDLRVEHTGQRYSFEGYRSAIDPLERVSEGRAVLVITGTQQGPIDVEEDECLHGRVLSRATSALSSSAS
jgi:hypothetical protein